MSLSEALGRDASNGTALSDLILVYLRNGDLEFADFYLDQAVSTSGKRNPPPGIYRTIGDLFASVHRMEEALSAWEYFRVLGGADPGVDEKLDRGRRELSVRQPQRIRTAEGLVLYTDASIPQDVTDRIEEHLEREVARLASLLPSDEPRGPEIAIVYEGRAYFSLVSIPTWVSGVFDGKIRVSLESPARWRPELAAVLSHELMHAYLRDISKSRAPAWLHEGLAQWFQGERVTRRDLRAWFSRRKIRGISEMETGLGRRPDHGIARDIYVEALGLVEFLVDERGIGTIDCLVKDLSAGSSLDAALVRETGWSAAELVARWEKVIRS